MSGIDKLQEASLTLAKIGNGFGSALEDGKISWLEWIGLTPKLFGLISIVKERNEIITEFKDLDETEKEILRAAFKAEFDLKDDTLELIIEKCYNIILDLSKLIDLFKKTA